MQGHTSRVVRRSLHWHRATQQGCCSEAKSSPNIRQEGLHHLLNAAVPSHCSTELASAKLLHVMFNYNMHSGVVMGNEPSICHDDGPLVERINKLSQELFGTPVHKNYPAVIGLEVIEGAPADLLLNYSNNPVGPTNSLQTQVG